MRVELPECEKCCFCCPLRPGLIAWGYIKLVLTIFVIILQFLVEGVDGIFTGILFFVDIAFIITFLISAHRKDYKLMRVYYYYSHVMVVLSFLAVITCIVLTLMGLFGSSLVHFFFTFLLMALFGVFVMNTVAQFYITLLIRSEISKLKNNVEFKFVKKVVADEPGMEAHTVKVEYGRLNTDLEELVTETSETDYDRS